MDNENGIEDVAVCLKSEHTSHIIDDHPLKSRTLEQRLDRIEQMLEQLSAVLLNGQAFNSSGINQPSMSIAEQAIQLAKLGRIEESKELLRAYSKRSRKVQNR